MSNYTIDLHTPNTVTVSTFPEPVEISSLLQEAVSLDLYSNVEGLPDGWAGVMYQHAVSGRFFAIAAYGDDERTVCRAIAAADAGDDAATALGIVHMLARQEPA